MTTEARRRAQYKYNKAHTKQITLRLNKRTDADIIEHLQGLGNKQGYIKRLIRLDMLQSLLDDAVYENDESIER